jgi:hypothetical protein
MFIWTDERYRIANTPSVLEGEQKMVKPQYSRYCSIGERIDK